ncbi:MAG TPA: PAS domain S-box protein, partial [Gaiellaceae bacterium]
MSDRWTGFGSDRPGPNATPTEGLAAERERALREQKLYLESLLKISPTAIVTLGLNRKITSWNLAAEELFGYTAADAIGRNLEDLVANREDLHAEYT